MQNCRSTCAGNARSSGYECHEPATRERPDGHQHDHDPGAALGDGHHARARRRRGGIRPGRRLLRRRVPLHRRPAEEIRHLAGVRCADLRERHHRRRGRHGCLRPAPGSGDPVRRLRLPGLRPVDLRGGAPALSLGRRLHRADDRTHALWRRHLRRADAQPEPGGDVHPGLRPAHGDAVQPLRRQGPADRLHRERRPGDLPRAQAPLQRPVRWPPRPPGDALVQASGEPGAGRLLQGAAGQGPARR